MAIGQDPNGTGEVVWSLDEKTYKINTIQKITSSLGSHYVIKMTDEM